MNRKMSIEEILLRLDNNMEKIQINIFLNFFLY